MAELRLDSYPEDVRRILAAVGKAMGPRRLHPDIVRDNAAAWESLIEKQHVTIKHTSKDELGGKSGRYEIAIHGKRWDGATWWFRPGELEQLARKAAE